MPEEWKPIFGYEERYEVSNHGRVRRVIPGKNTFAGKILSPFKSRKGYLQVKLSKGSRYGRRTFFVHCLVAEEFIGPKPPGMQVNHKDGCKPNNWVSNLEYVSNQGNRTHAVVAGLVARGSRMGSAKLTEADIPVIRQLAAELGPTAVARMYGVCHAAIIAITTGKTWKHVA